MTPQIPELERHNSVTSGLRRLKEASVARVPKPGAVAEHTTLPDGRVIDRSGRIVYEPTKPTEKKP
jgi:hypothetical protein